MALPKAQVLLEVSGDIKKAKFAAAVADVAVVVVGSNSMNEGEYTVPAMEPDRNLDDVILPCDGSKEAQATYERLTYTKTKTRDIGKDNDGLGTNGDRREPVTAA